MHESRQCGLGRRRDRVDLATAHGLNLRVGVGDDLEGDRVELRLLAVPLRVLLEDHALALRVAGHVERAVRDRVAVVTADAVVPVVVELLTLEREARVDVAEQVAVVRERLALLPEEGHRLAVALGPSDVRVANGGRDVAGRVRDDLPRVDVVRRRDRLGLVAEPVPVGVLLDRDPEELLGGHHLRRHVEVILALVVDDVGAANDRRTGDDGSVERVLIRVAEVEAGDRLLEAEDHCLLGRARGGSARDVRKRLRKRGRMKRRSRVRALPGRHRGSGAGQPKYGDHRCSEEPDPSMHWIYPPFGAHREPRRRRQLAPTLPRSVRHVL